MSHIHDSEKTLHKNISGRGFKGFSVEFLGLRSRVRFLDMMEENWLTDEINR